MGKVHECNDRNCSKIVSKLQNYYFANKEMFYDFYLLKMLLVK